VLRRGLEVLFSSYLSSSIDSRPLKIIEGIPTLLFCPSFAHARVRADLGCNDFPNIYFGKRVIVGHYLLMTEHIINLKSLC
jgi:hypothetical protein